MSRGKPPAPAIAISLRQYRILEKAASKQTISHRYKVRFGIILRASQGQSNSGIKRDLGISLNKVKRWRKRWESEWEALNIYESGVNDKVTKDYELLSRMQEMLCDKPRSGTPKRITMSQEKQIIAVACEKPDKYGIQMTRWNREMLVKVVIEKGIIDTISPRYISVILKKNELRPHKSNYWLFPNIVDWKAFVVRVSLVCQLILKVIDGDLPDTHLISVDEKTSIQALERIWPAAAMKKGKPRRIESEYIRHGTTCLMAAYDVGKSNILNHWTGPTRKEEDFLHFIQHTTAKVPQQDKVIYLLDRLNTHMSQSLIIWIAEKERFEGDLGTKNYKGILRNMKSRIAFLENPDHRIRFVFTPKHCSWLNPVENWFSKLSAHVIKYGNFSSVKELENKIDRYIQFYNDCLVKPLKWKFKGFVKARKLYCLKLRA